MPTDTFRTLSTAAQAETPRVKGSRFLADAFPVTDAEQALERIADVRRREHSATHHVWAYRLGADGAEFRSSDDGEPSGSAGIPVLRAIESAEITNAVVVTTRYYGGTKLGTGGLARAYSDAAAVVLAGARVVQRIVRQPVRLRFGFDDTSAAMRLIDRFDALIRAQEYTVEGTDLDLDVRLSEVAALEAAFVEATAGRGQIVDHSAVGSTAPQSPNK